MVPTEPLRRKDPLPVSQAVTVLLLPTFSSPGLGKHFPLFANSVIFSLISKDEHTVILARDLAQWHSTAWQARGPEFLKPLFSGQPPLPGVGGWRPAEDNWAYCHPSPSRADLWLSSSLPFQTHRLTALSRDRACPRAFV